MKKNIKTQKQLSIFSDPKIIFFVIALILLVVVPTFYFFLLKSGNHNKKPSSAFGILENIEIRTDKAFYAPGDKITLFIENKSEQSIYSEPCRYLANFEKKIGESWISLENNIKEKFFDKSEFNRSRGVTKCSVGLFGKEEGLYRILVKIYYGCSRPEKCEGSDNFYSNEFSVEK